MRGVDHLRTGVARHVVGHVAANRLWLVVCVASKSYVAILAGADSICTCTVYNVRMSYALCL